MAREMPQRFVELVTSSETFQRSLIEEVLLGAAIPFETVEGHVPSAFLGSANVIVDIVFRVPEDRLQEAKAVLCGHGIVCNVSERLLLRSFEEAVKPLLESHSGDFDRLKYLLGINNKETVRALFDLTLREKGGQELLESLFFALAADNVTALRILVRALHGKTSEPFSRRFLSELESASKPARLGFLEVLPEFSSAFPRDEALTLALRDQDPEIRDAAGEALFSIKRTDYGFDPAAPDNERERAIERFLKAARLA